MHNPRSRMFAALFTLVLSAGPGAAIDPSEQNRLGEFAVIGVAAPATPSESRIAEKLFAFQCVSRDFVLMGDSSYNGDTAKDLQEVFEHPYPVRCRRKVLRPPATTAILTSGSTLFNMNGDRYFTLPKNGVPSAPTQLEQGQLAWLEKELAPANQTGRSASSIIRSIRQRHARVRLELRDQLEPLFVA